MEIGEQKDIGHKLWIQTIEYHFRGDCHLSHHAQNPADFLCVCVCVHAYIFSLNIHLVFMVAASKNSCKNEMWRL